MQLAAASYDDEILDDGPRWFLKFDETSGSVAGDSGPNGVSGEISGTPTLGAEELALDGGNSLDNIGNQNGVGVSDPASGLTGISLEAWFNVSGTLSRQGLMIAMNDSTNSSYQHQLYVQGTDDPGLGYNNSVNFRVRDAWNGGLTTIGATNTIQAGHTYHVVATAQEGAPSRLYLNGNLIASGPGPVDLAGWAAGWRIARGSAGPPYQNLNGRIDNVALYYYALTPAQITAHYAALSPYETFGSCNPSELHRCQASRGDPVNTATGNFYEDFTDLAVPGRGVPLAFTRTYNSLKPDDDGPLGYGWSHSYMTSLNLDGDRVIVNQGNGSLVVFTLSGGDYRAPPRVSASLVHNGDGTWTLTRRAREFLTFDVAGRLIKVEDLNGRAAVPPYATTLSYDGSGRLETVTESRGSDADAGVLAVGVAQERDRFRHVCPEREFRLQRWAREPDGRDRCGGGRHAHDLRFRPSDADAAGSESGGVAVAGPADDPL